MCGGVRMMQGRRPTLIHISALVQKTDAMINHSAGDYHHSYFDAEKAAFVNNTVQEQDIMGYGGSSNSYSETESVITKEQGSSSSSSASSSAVGLGIVAALSMELSQSPAATTRPSRPVPVPAHQENDQRHSIFFTAAAAASPPFSSSVLYSNNKLFGDDDEYGEVVDEQSCTPDFLRACFLCRSPLRPGRDIYMYRGDRAFCSIECRYQQIDIDEYNERCPTMNVCKGDQASDINKVNYHTVQIVG